MAEFRMPSLGADMDEGTLVEWLVRPGQAVHKGDIVAVVDTSKSTIEVECFETGEIDRLLAQPGDRVPVGAPLAIIQPAGAAEAAPAAEAVPALVPSAPPAPARGPAAGGGRVTSPLVRRLAARKHLDLSRVHGTGIGGRITHADVEAQAATATAPGGRTRASPLARRIAAELGLDLTAVTGTGPDGVVREADVRRAATRPVSPVVAAAPEPATASPARAPAAGVDRAAGMRAAIAALMARSKREIPHYYLTETVDLGDAMAWMRDRNRQLPVPKRLVPAALLLKAAAVALRAVPELNGFWIDDRFVAGEDVHLGVAIALRGGGLVAPAIHRAADLELPELMASLRDLVARTRAGRLRRTELSDGTVTVSNMGDQGAESIIGVIYPPQVALVGFGRIVDRPWAVHGLIGVRPVVTVTLSADHRATDGATGARYLQTLAHLLERPEEL
jgi:pyruvate dehydrogenase E2 component (dihydrolipoamide acetyltransferase)